MTKMEQANEEWLVDDLLSHFAEPLRSGDVEGDDEGNSSLLESDDGHGTMSFGTDAPNDAVSNISELTAEIGQLKEYGIFNFTAQSPNAKVAPHSPVTRAMVCSVPPELRHADDILKWCNQVILEDQDNHHIYLERFVANP